MADKLVNIVYAPTPNTLPVTQQLVADINIPQTSALVSPSTLITDINFDSTLKVTVNGAEESSVPTSGKYRRLFDQFSVNNPNYLLVSKLLNNNLTLADTFFTQTDFVRVPVSTIGSQDLISNKTVEKVTATQIAGVNDSIAKSVGLLAEPDFSIVFDIHVLNSQLSKLSPVHTLTQTSTLANKALNNLLMSTEHLNRTVDYLRSFQDYVDITDDYYGEANLDDDQIAYFNKKLINIFGYYEERLISPQVVKTDGINTASQQIKSIGLAKPENLALSTTTRFRPRKALREVLDPFESVAKLAQSSRFDRLNSTNDVYFDTQTLKYVSDGAATQTSARFAIGSTLSSTLLTQTELSKVIESNYTSQFQLADVAALLIQPVNADILNASVSQSLYFSAVYNTNILVDDSTTKVVDYNRNFTDLVYPTDDYYGLANIDDDQTAVFNKNILAFIAPLEYVTFDSTLVKSSQLVTETIYSVTAQTQYSDKMYSTSELSTYTNKAETSFSNTTEIFSTLVSAQYQNQALTNTVLETQAYKPLSNTTVLQDSDYSSTVALEKFNAATLQQQISSVVGLDKSNAVFPVIYTEKAFDKIYSDTLNELSEQLSYADLVTKLVQANVQDVISFIKYIDYILTSQISATDSGFANNQNYFAEAYVTPGYVGTNTNFS